MKAEDLVLRFIREAEARVGRAEGAEDLTRALLLLGRCKDYRWVNNNIFTRLLKRLADIWTQSDGDQSFMCWVISTLGLLSRVYPAEGREQLKSIMESVSSILQVTGGIIHNNVVSIK